MRQAPTDDAHALSHSSALITLVACLLTRVRCHLNLLPHLTCARFLQCRRLLPLPTNAPLSPDLTCQVHGPSAPVQCSASALLRYPWQCPLAAPPTQACPLPTHAHTATGHRPSLRRSPHTSTPSPHTTCPSALRPALPGSLLYPRLAFLEY